MGVAIKILIFNARCTILKKTLLDFSDTSADSQTAVSGDDTETEDTTPVGELGDGVLEVTALNWKDVATLTPGSEGLRIVDSGNHVYGFYLKKEGDSARVDCLTLDQGLEGTPMFMTVTDSAEGEVYSFDVASLSDEKLVMVT